MKYTHRFAMCMLVFMLSSAVVLPTTSWAKPPSENRNDMKHEGKGAQKKSRTPAQHGNKAPAYDGRTTATVLATAGITALAARELARSYSIGGQSALPPGIQKNLLRGKPLPPGIAKKSVPGSMLAKLPMHPGYEWRMVGRDLVLISIATAVVADVLQGVFH